jgi:hypothetical protein
MISTTDNKQLDRREKLAKMREYHQDYFDAAGVPRAYFYPKLAYRPEGKDELYCGFFPSEMEKETDVYLEFASSKYDPEDPERNLYVWKFNPHYETEYEKTAPGANGVVRYLVPVAELRKINKAELLSDKTSEQNAESPKNIADISINIGDPELDCPMNAMTVRDLAAILLRQPVSQKKWLNDIINQTKV